MIAQTIAKQLDSLYKEVNILRSFIIGITSPDPEGEYRQEFIKSIREASLEKPIHKYFNRGSLLKLIKKTK